MRKALARKKGQQSRPSAGSLGVDANQFLIQELDDTIVFRLRCHAGQATCPGVAVRLQSDGDGTRFDLSSHLASSGNRALISATSLLCLLSAASAVGIVTNNNPYGWTVGLISIGILLFIWVKAFAARAVAERCTNDYLNGVLSSLQTDLLAAKGEAADLTRTSLTYSESPPSAEVYLPPLQELPDDGGTSRVVLLNHPFKTVLGSLYHLVQSNKTSIPGLFGVSPQPEFTLKFKKDTLELTRIRPTNSVFFRSLLQFVRFDGLPLQWMSLDFAPGLTLQLVPSDGKTEVRVKVKISLFRKVWTTLMYTAILPLGIFGLAIGPLFLASAMATGNVEHIIAGLMLTAGVGGALWTVADMDSSDRTEYMLLMEQLEHILERVTNPEEPSLSPSIDFSSASLSSPSPAEEADIGASFPIHEKSPLV